MKKHGLICTMIVFATLIIGSCNLPLSETAQPVNVQTAVANTLEALAKTNAAGNAPTAIVNTIPGATNTLLPTNTFLPTLTPYPTYTPYPTNTPIPCNQAHFESETILDNTHFTAGTAFTKTWTLRNAGSCTWTTGYKVVFDHGDALGAAATINLAGNVAPGQTITISIPMTAPATAGTYSGWWKLQDNNGNSFGLEPSNKTFSVVIISDTVPFALTSAIVTVHHTHVEASCPYTFNFTAEITSTAAGTAEVWWVRSDGNTSPHQNITFTSASTITITTEWEIGISYSGWVMIGNDYPNHQTFDLQRADFELVCTP